MRLRNRSNMPNEFSDANNSDDIEVPHFNVRRFIAEVEYRPAIWDTTSRIYSDKQMKKKSWDELVDIFINNGNPSEDERSEYCRILQRKWKSARDCFNRECQRLKMVQMGVVTSRKSPYVFYKNLSFLHKVMNKNKLIKNADSTMNDTSSTMNDTSNTMNDTSNTMNDTSNTMNDTSNSTDVSAASNTDSSVNTTDTSSVSNTDTLSHDYAVEILPTSAKQIHVNDVYHLDDDGDNDYYFSTGPSTSTGQRPKRRKVENNHNDDSVLTRMLQPNVQLIEGKVPTTESAAKTPEDDSDRLFLLSLLEPLKRVPDRLRMPVRVRIIQAVDKAIHWDKELGLE